jgi:hypothetical protein
MTKLNITNKRLYKLKKHKHQSKKNFPKKRKNRRRRARRGGGKSFRKRRKYNIKNNSIKRYHQTGGQGGNTKEMLAKAAHKESEIINSKWKSVYITKHQGDDELLKWLVVKNAPYIPSDDSPFALSTYVQETLEQGDNEFFFNFYLNKKIIKDGTSKDLYLIIMDRITRHVNHIIKNDDPNINYSTEELQHKALQQIGGKMKEIFLTSSDANAPRTNFYKEKVDALTFLHWIFDITKNYNSVNFEEDIKTTIDDETLNMLFYLYVEGYNPDGGLTAQLAQTDALKDKINVPEEDKIKNAFEEVKKVPKLIECAPTTTDDEFLADKLNLALGKLLLDFETKDWTKQNTEDFEENEDFDKKGGEISELNEGLKTIFDEKMNELTTKIENIKTGEDNSKKLDELKTKIDTLKEQLQKTNEGKAEKMFQSAQMGKEIAGKEEEKYEGKLKEKEDELNKQEEALNKKQEEIDAVRAEMEILKKSINDCNQDDPDKKKGLEDKLKAEEEKLATKEEENTALKTEVDTLTDERDSARGELNDAKVALATAEANVVEAKNDEENAKNPTEVPEENLLKDEGDEEEEDVAGYFDSVAGKTEKGVIKAPMADDGEVIIYLKRRPSDGKFVVSTLGTGGESDSTNVWISNIGHAPEAAVEEGQTEDHTEG